MMKVLPLKGYNSLRAFNARSNLLLGIKMLPEYMGESYESFYQRIDALEPEKQQELFFQAAKHVELDKSEVEAFLSFCEDPNGVPYNPANLKSLGPDKIIEAIVSVCMEISKIKIDIISDDEKKN